MKKWKNENFGDIDSKKKKNMVIFFFGGGYYFATQLVEIINFFLFKWLANLYDGSHFLKKEEYRKWII